MYLLLNYFSECSNYVTLNEATRNSQHTTSTLYCDSLSQSSRGNWVGTGWYRFEGDAGVQLSEYPICRDRCGTHGAGWLNGVHPTQTDTAEQRQVCFNLQNSGNTCSNARNIMVRNCGSYYVYQLEDLGGCWYRYCGSNPAGVLVGMK